MKFFIVSAKHHEAKLLKDYISHLPYKEYFPDEHVTIEAVGDGAKAEEQIKLLAERGEKIDFIISADNAKSSDSKEEITGMEFAEFLNNDKRFRNIPLILFAQWITKKMAAKARDSKVRAWLVQPFSYQNFYDTITRIVDEDIANEELRRRDQLKPLFEETSMELDEKLKAIYSDSLREVEKILRLAPWSVPAQISIAKIHCGKNDFEAALPILKKIVRNDFKEKSAHRLLILCYKRLGKAFEDTADLEFRLRSNPESATLNQLLGESLLRDGDYTHAAVCFQKAIELHKKHESFRLKAKSHVGLGESKMTQADVENKPELRKDAVNNFETGRQIDPHLLSAYFNLVTVYKKMGQAEKANKVFREMADIAPDTAEDWLSMFKAYLSGGDLNKARYSIDKAIELDPENQIILVEAGKIYIRQAMYETALEMFNKACDINPSDLRVYNYMGICLRRLDKYEEALMAYNKALEINTSDPSVYFNLGRALEDLGRWGEALNYYKEALKIDPGLELASSSVERLSARKEEAQSSDA